MHNQPDQRIPILQLINGFAVEDGAGGVALFGMQLARALDHSRYRVHVCALWGYSSEAEQRWRTQLHREGIETTLLIDRPTSLGRDMLRALARLMQVVARVRPHIINSHFERGDLLALLVRLATYWQFRRFPPRLVRTMHTEQQWQTRPWLGVMLNVLAFPWLCAAEVAISRDTAVAMDRRWAARLGKRRAVVLYNGLAPEHAARLLALPLRQRTDVRPPRLTLIGRLEQQKGVFDFVEAGAAILKAYPQAEFWVIGTGSLQAPMRDYAVRLGIASAMRFFGQRDDVPTLLQEVDILLSSSYWEGFPTVILEAMMAGVPVVATAVSGSRELVQDGVTGRLVPVGQPQMLAAAAVWLLANPTAAYSLAERARHSASHHTLTATAAGYDRLYRSLLNKPS
jgi:glycosyltransferase involved in cell wall biosynthesis